MKTNSSSSSAASEHRTLYKNRLRCRVLAATDLVWRLGEFAYAVLVTFLPAVLSGLNITSTPLSSLNADGTSSGGGDELLTSTGTASSNQHVNRGGSKFLLLLGGGIPDKTDAHYEVMDTRVYNFLLNPILTFCYFVAFFLQISISFFLFCETSSYGKSASHQNEIAACTIWSRIAVISLIILLLRFFLPYALITVASISYTTSRILFKVFGIVIVIVHARELKSSLSGDEEDGLQDKEDEESEHKRRRSETSSGAERRSRFQSSSSADFVEIELPFKHPSPMPTSNSFYSNNRKPKTGDMERVKMHIVQVEVYVEKEMYDQALAELKIAQEVLRHNSHLSTMESTIVKMMNLSSSFNGGGGGAPVDEAMSKDYYGILGVPKHSTTEVIKTAYRKKSLRHHPDKHITEPESVQKMEGIRYMKVREAYEVLSDPGRRTNYDETIRLNKEKMEKLHKRLKTMLDSFNNSLSIPLIVS